MFQVHSAKRARLIRNLNQNRCAASALFRFHHDFIQVQIDENRSSRKESDCLQSSQLLDIRAK